MDFGQLEPFRKDWESARHDEGFDVFHMADFNGHFEEFSDAKWNDEAKRQRTLRRLICIAKTRARYCASVAVDRSSYTDVILSDPKLAKICGKYHYTFAVHGCLDLVYQWKKDFATESRLKYIFDQMSRGKGEIISIFDAYRKHPENVFGMARGGYSYESKADVWQLQAADILAWHMYQQMVEHELRGLPVRADARYFMEMPHKTGYYTHPILEKLRDGMRKEEAYANISV